MGNHVDDSVALIRKVEMDRFVLTPNNKDVSSLVDKEVESDIEDNDIDNLSLGHLCGGLTEEVMDVVMEGQSGSPHVAPQNKKGKKIVGYRSCGRLASKKTNFVLNERSFLE